MDIASFLDSPALPDDALSEIGIAESEGSEGSSGLSSGWQEPSYEGAIDYRIRQLSYSSLLTLHSCPRKFQLYKLRTTHKTAESLKTTITFVS